MFWHFLAWWIHLRDIKLNFFICRYFSFMSSWNQCASANPEGGDRGSGPPGKSQVIWVSIGNKQLDPHPHWKKLDPPGKCWTPSGTLKNDSFLWNWPFDFCKISRRLKKRCQSLFCQIDLVPPPPPPEENSRIRAWCELIWVEHKESFITSKPGCFT